MLLGCVLVCGCFVDNQHLLATSSAETTTEAPTTAGTTTDEPTSDTGETTDETEAGPGSESESDTATMCPARTENCPCASPDDPCQDDLICSGEMCVVPGICGNTVLENGESCDDGNAIDGDGCNADCQPSGQQIWDHMFNGPSSQSDRARDVAVGPDGAIYVAGEITIVGAGRNAWIRKYTPGGSVVWTATYNGADNLDDAALGIAVDPNGSVIVVGYTTTASATLAWAHRYLSDDGAPAWSEAITFGEGIANGVAIETDGSAYIAGSAPSLLMLTGLDATVRKIDATGTIVWETGLDDAEAGDDEFLDVHLGPTSLIACGYNSSNADDVKVQGFDRVTGDVVEAGEEYDGGASEQGVACTVTADGRVLILADEREGGNETAYTLLQYGSDLTLDSQLRVNMRRAGGITHDADTDDVFIGGSTLSDGQFSDLFVRRAPLADPSNEHWQYIYDGPANGEDHVSAVARMPDGGLAAVGWTAVTDQGTDIWVARFTP